MEQREIITIATVVANELGIGPKYIKGRRRPLWPDRVETKKVMARLKERLPDIDFFLRQAANGWAIMAVLPSTTVPGKEVKARIWGPAV